MLTKEEILNFLRIDSMNNVNAINFVEGYPITYCDRIGNSAIIKGTSDRDWVYISSKSEKELIEIKDKLNDEDRNFAIIEDWMVPILSEGRRIKWILSTMRLFYPLENINTLAHHDYLPLSRYHAEFIYDSSDYKDFLSVEYIEERILHGISSCIMKENKPVAWGITQDDGAIGFLHVLPEFRGKGYGKLILADLVYKAYLQNKLPFVHIEEDNEKSKMLAEALGFKKDKMVNWFELE